MFFMSANCATWICIAGNLTTDIRTTAICGNAVVRHPPFESPYILMNATIESSDWRFHVSYQFVYRHMLNLP
jgi:hypothetical protein